MAGHPILNEQNLKPSHLEVISGHDTLVRGKGGTLLFIPKNSFLLPDGTQAKGSIFISIREALTPLDMVLGNLTTTANGRLLESGGMVFIDATQGGQKLKIKTGSVLTVSIPTEKRLTGMQVFRGERNSMGELNWASSVPLTDSTTSARMALGNQLFQANCAVCHGLDSLIVGPPLANVHTRRGALWIYSFVRNSMRMLERKDTAALALYEQYNKQVMPSFDMTPQQVGAILTYLSGASFTVDSLSALSEADVLSSTQVSTLDERLYYLFDLKDLGWINVDRFPDEVTPRVPFFVEIAPGEPHEEVQVTILFKAQRIYLTAYPGKDGRYSFSPSEDESLSQLPKGLKATVIATARKGETYYLGLKEVTIGKGETATVTLQSTMAGQLLKTLETNL